MSYTLKPIGKVPSKGGSGWILLIVLVVVGYFIYDYYKKEAPKRQAADKESEEMDNLTKSAGVQDMPTKEDFQDLLQHAEATGEDFDGNKVDVEALRVMAGVGPVPD